MKRDAQQRVVRVLSRINIMQCIIITYMQQALFVIVTFDIFLVEYTLAMLIYILHGNTASTCIMKKSIHLLFILFSSIIVWILTLTVPQSHRHSILETC
jgi:hypothetical protein